MRQTLIIGAICLALTAVAGHPAAKSLTAGKIELKDDKDASALTVQIDGKYLESRGAHGNARGLRTGPAPHALHGVRSGRSGAGPSRLARTCAQMKVRFTPEA